MFSVSASVCLLLTEKVSSVGEKKDEHNENTEEQVTKELMGFVMGEFPCCSWVQQNEAQQKWEDITVRQL